MRGLRKISKLDDCEAKALSEIDISHLHAIARLMRRLNRSCEVSVLETVLPILTRDISLPKHLSSLSRQDLPKAASDVITLHSATRDETILNGTIASVVKALYDQIVKLLTPQLPIGCSLLQEVCTGELSRALAKGWSPQLAGGIFLHRFLSNPKQYVAIHRTMTHSNHSSAPYRVSRSECRG